MSGPLLLVDLPWLLYRSHFGVPSSVRGADGAPIGALQGTVTTILAEVAALAPAAVGVCVGAEDAVHRVALLPAYHAHRDPMPDALRHRWVQAPALCAALGWAVRDAGDHEADDALATLAHERSAAGGRAAILTADRDLMACVDERVVVRRPGGRGTGIGTVDAAGVRAQVGVDPAAVADLIALRGDPSDGIPGAPGIGAKTAAALLAAHGDLEGVLVAAGAAAPGADDVALPAAAIGPPPVDRPAEAYGGRPDLTGPLTPRLAAALREHAPAVRRDRAVAALVRVPVAPVPDAATDPVAGAMACAELGMGGLAGRLRGTGAG